MRLLGDRAMSGAERMRRYREAHREAHRERKTAERERVIAERVAADLADLPDWIDPEYAEPIITAWRRRGLRYAITPAQWSTRSSSELRDPIARRIAVEAIEEAPSWPAPAWTVWGTLMYRLQGLRARVATRVRAAIVPRVQAQALHRPAPIAPPPDSAGYQAWRAVGESLRRMPT